MRRKTEAKLREVELEVLRSHRGRRRVAMSSRVEDVIPNPHYIVILQTIIRTIALNSGKGGRLLQLACG